MRLVRRAHIGVSPSQSWSEAQDFELIEEINNVVSNEYYFILF